MSDTLNKYREQTLETKTLQMFNSEALKRSISMSMKCFKCNYSIMFCIVPNNVYKSKIDNLDDLVKLQNVLYCPICGFKHNLLESEVVNVWM